MVNYTFLLLATGKISLIEKKKIGRLGWFLFDTEEYWGNKKKDNKSEKSLDINQKILQRNVPPRMGGV